MITATVLPTAATPRETVAKLNASIVRALNSSDVQERFRTLGQTAAPSTQSDFADYIRLDYERWGKVVKASGATVE